MFSDIARFVDGLTLAFAVGSTAWFFFIQSPVLIKKLGRDRFVPIQMRLTKVLFKSLSISLAIMVVASVYAGWVLGSKLILTAIVGCLAALINTYIVVPKALQAGGQGLRESQPESEQTSVTNFASLGAGQASRFWHRTVVLFVVMMLMGLLPHAYFLVNV
jgi:hypothetical protein